MTGWLRRGAFGLLITLVAMAAWPLWLRVTGNLHPVVAGALYRSAQPEPGDLGRWTRRYGLRSVLNLRGAHDDADWYLDERRASADLHLVHVDFAMSGRRDPGPERIAEFVGLLRALPKPLLVHCRGGADRTGLAAALYLAAVEHAGEAAAEGQLSFAFGHVGLPVAPEHAMDDAWEAAERSLGYPGS